MADPSADFWTGIQVEQERFQAMEVDESLILANLRLSPAERLRQHDRHRALVQTLRDAFERGAGNER